MQSRRKTGSRKQDAILTKRRALLRGAVVFYAVVLLAVPAHANLIIPAFFAHWVGIVLALIPVIIIETIIVSMIGGTSWRLSTLAMTVANFATTLVGLPLAILHDFLSGLKFGLNGEGKPAIWDSKLGLPVGLALFMFFLFGLSWWIETSIAIWFLDPSNLQVVNEGVFYANVTTYSCFLLYLLVMGVWDAVLTTKSTNTKRDWLWLHDRHMRKKARNATKHIALQYRKRPVFEADLLRTWRFANRHAKHGIAALASVEADIIRRTSANPENSGLLNVIKRVRSSSLKMRRSHVTMSTGLSVNVPWWGLVCLQG